MGAPDLSAEALLARAEKGTGLADYGDPTFRDRFGLAVEHINSVPMNQAGRAAAIENCNWLLTTRLEFFEDFKRYPIAEEKIVRPLFATGGEPRSGTTLLHALLAADPEARSLRFWEVMYPSPPPGLAAPDDPRRALADRDWREINAKMPKWLISHPYNDMLGDGLPECERTWAFDFRVMTPTAWWRVPMGVKFGGFPVDPPAQYRLHKMMLQHGQYARPKRHWALKGFHSPRLAALFGTYPDARLIWIHRDPVQAIASRIKMAADLNEGLTGGVDIKAIAPIHVAAGRASMQATLQNQFLDDPRILHVRYPDFIADPIALIRRFYAFADQTFTAAAEAEMRSYLANNKGDRYGKFCYSTDLIGEDIESLHAEFEPFRRRFGLEIEKHA